MTVSSFSTIKKCASPQFYVLPPFGNDNPFGSKRLHFGRIKNRIAPAENSRNLCFRGVSTIFVTHQLLSKKLVWKKVTSSKKRKVGKNTELFIQIGIIFVKKASSRLISEHFHDTWYTFLKSTAFREFRLKNSKLCLP